MKRMIIRFIVSIIVVFFFRSVIRYFLNKESKERALLKERSTENMGYVVVKESSSMKRLIGLCVIGYAIFPCAAYFSGGGCTVTFYILCGILILVAAYYVMLCVWNIKVFLNEDYFIVTTYFGERYIIKYSEIISFKLSSNRIASPLGYVIRAKNKKFSVNEAAINYEIFHNQLIEHGIIKENTFDEIISFGNANVGGDMQTNRGNDHTYVIAFPKKYFVLSFLVSISSIAVLYLSLYNDPANVSLGSFFGLLTVFACSSLCALFFFGWRFEFSMSKDTFEYTWWLGVKFNIRYKDIDYCEYKGNYLKIVQKYVDKILYIYNKTDNFEVFINQLTERGILKEGISDGRHN